MLYIPWGDELVATDMITVEAAATPIVVDVVTVAAVRVFSTASDIIDGSCDTVIAIFLVWLFEDQLENKYSEYVVVLLSDGVV